MTRKSASKCNKWKLLQEQREIDGPEWVGEDMGSPKSKIPNSADIEKTNIDNPEIQLWNSVLLFWVRDLVSPYDKVQQEAYKEMFGPESTLRTITLMLGWPKAQHNEFKRKASMLYHASFSQQASNHPIYKIRQMHGISVRNQHAE